MSYINPKLRNQFESLTIELQDVILKRNVQINTLNDLIHVLEEIVDEGK